jgi:hypothetical protein
MSSSAVQSFTLEVPANNQAIGNLIRRIMDEVANGEVRINLHFGTCSLMCEDELEREEHGANVTANYALRTLMSSMSCCNEHPDGHTCCQPCKSA